MSAAEEVRPIFERALALLDEKEKKYGDAWRTCGRETSLRQLHEKSNYVKVLGKRKHYPNDVHLEDLLDLINRGAFAYYHIDKETNSEESKV